MRDDPVSFVHVPAAVQSVATVLDRAFVGGVSLLADGFITRSRIADGLDDCWTFIASALSRRDGNGPRRLLVPADWT